MSGRARPRTAGPGSISAAPAAPAAAGGATAAASGRVAPRRDAARLALGAWYTPAAVADLALSLALPPGAARRRARVLDPACGDGVFLARARAAGVPAARLCGIDIDAAAAGAARARVRGADIRACDLFDVDPAGAGWDVVVGNPPYVRAERLSPAVKRRVRGRLAADWPAIPAQVWDRVLGRGDLAAAVLLRALRLARPGGAVALVVSSALLDAGYAGALWSVVARVGRVRAIVDAPDERWFPDAAVNAVVIVIERAMAAQASGAANPDGEPAVQVARLIVPTARAAAGITLDALGAIADVRSAPAADPGRWAVALRAPRAWFAFEQAAAAGALVPLGELAEVRRGITSGANEVFYLPRDRAAALALETAVLVPLLRSPREAAAQTIDVDPARTSHVALVCPPGAEILARCPVARRYLDAHAGAADRPSLRARSPWWALPARPARLFLTKAYSRRFVQRLARAPMVADQRVYAVRPRARIDVAVLAAVLNSTWTALALESLGRASMGEGALEWTVAGAAALPVLDPRRLDRGGAGRARAALAVLARRPIGDIGGERAHADRAALDAAVAAIAPGADALRPAVWSGLIEAVERRNRRARR